MGKKLKTKDIFGYTIGSIGDCASYNFVLSFFSFFMTTVAGVSPAVAGTIISVAIDLPFEKLFCSSIFLSLPCCLMAG